MGQHLSVGLRRKRVAVGDHCRLQFEVILDDAVVNDCHLATLVNVGMGVVIHGLAMRGPTSVADAGGGRHGATIAE